MPRDPEASDSCFSILPLFMFCGSHDPSHTVPGFNSDSSFLTKESSLGVLASCLLNADSHSELTCLRLQFPRPPI